MGFVSMSPPSKKQAGGSQQAASGSSQFAPGRLEVPHQSQEQGHDSSIPPAKRGSNLACLKCRAIKVKCWKANSNDPRCARCNRLDLFCEFREHHRGKKLEKLIQDQDRSQLDTPEQLQQARAKLALCSSYPINIEVGTLMGLQNALDADPARVSGSQMPAFGASSSKASSDSSTPASSSNSVVATSIYDDVARLTQLTWQDAGYLFNLFVNHLNPVLALLDTQLHTASYTRERSPLFFSAILAVSSRFFRPEVYPQCNSAAEAVLNLAEAERVCTLDHVQALIVLSIWCDVQDTSRPRKLVKAISLAHELGLPYVFTKGQSMGSKARIEPGHPQQADAHHDLLQTRTQQRTWIQLCLLELSQQSNTAKVWNRPPLITISDMPTARLWHDSDSAEMGANDARLAFLLDLALAQTGYNQLSETASSAALAQMVEELEARQASNSNTWLTEVGEEQVFRYGIDQHSRAEMAFLIPFSRFARAKQIWTCASRLCRQNAQDRLAEYQEQTWFATTTTLALGVLETFASKVLGQELLRLSPQYMSVGCFGAAHWLVSQATRLPGPTAEQAKTRITDILGLLARPQYYPDGSRIPPTSEMSGILDQALRLIAGPPSSPRAGMSDTDDASRSGLGAGRSRKRRGSNSSSLLRLEAGVDSVGSRSEGDVSDRGAEWPSQARPDARHDAWSDMGAPWTATGMQHYGRGTTPASDAGQSGAWQFSLSTPDLHRNVYAQPGYGPAQQYGSAVHYGFSPSHGFLAPPGPSIPSGITIGEPAMASGVVSGGEPHHPSLSHRHTQHPGQSSSSSYRASSLPSTYQMHPQTSVPFPPHHYPQRHEQQFPNQQHQYQRQHDDRAAGERGQEQLLNPDLHGLFSQMADNPILDWQQQIPRNDGNQ